MKEVFTFSPAQTSFTLISPLLSPSDIITSMAYIFAPHWYMVPVRRFFHHQSLPSHAQNASENLVTTLTLTSQSGKWTLTLASMASPLWFDSAFCAVKYFFWIITSIFHFFLHFWAARCVPLNIPAFILRFLRSMESSMALTYAEFTNCKTRW